MQVAKPNVAKGLLLMAKVLRGGPSVEKLDAETLDIWLVVMLRNDVTEEEWSDAVTEYMGHGTFFPAPADLLGIIRRKREDRCLTRARSEWDSMLVCTDGDGNFCLAKADSVLNGRLVERGDGNGLPSPDDTSAGPEQKERLALAVRRLTEKFDRA